jgi:uncharacterized delta-60 repeat protein
MPRSKHVPICAALFAAMPASAQQPAPSATWQQIPDVRYRGEAMDMEIAGNGDVVVAGFVPGVRGGVDAWIARYSEAGRQLWSTRVGGNQRDEAHDIAIAPNGDIIVAGWRDVGLQTYNGLLAGLDADGALLWETSLTQTGGLSLAQVEPLADGSIVVAGRHSSPNDIAVHPFLARLGDKGAVIWTFDPYEHSPVPAHAKSVIVPEPTFSIVSGVVELQQLFNQHPHGACVRVNLETGARQGDCDVAVPSSAKRNRGASSYFGEGAGAFNRRDPIVRKYDATGRMIWERTLESEANDALNDVASTPDGGVVGAGYMTPGGEIGTHNWDALLVKLDGDGKEVWRRKFGGSRRDEFTSVAITPDGSIVVAGYTGSQGNANDWSPWILRLNASGELEGEAKAELERNQK